MDIIILGSGTSIPIKERASPCLAVIEDEIPMIFDMGPGAVRKMAETDLDYTKIQHIFITHFHPDHTADLIHFLFASRIPNIAEKRRPFVVSGPEGLERLIRNIRTAYPDWLTLPAGLMKVVEFQTGKTTSRKFDNIKLSTAPVFHTEQSLAYRVTSEKTKKSMVYSGDTGPYQGIVDLAKGADLLILECSFPDGQEMCGHLTPSQAGEIATQAGVKRLVLTHFYPEVLKTDIEEACRKTYQGELILAEDLMRISI